MVAPAPHAAPDLPALYYGHTTPEEQARHAERLTQLAGGPDLLIEAVTDAAGGWQAELITTDWDEPGLLDRIFEAILNCVHIPGGIALRRVRIFTGRSGQVVNILELADKRGRALDRERMEMVLAQLRRIRRGERGALDTISNLTAATLIPSLTEFPELDNTRSPDYTHLDLRVPRLSNRFTSILLHFLARSEFQVNVQVAEFVQAAGGHYSLFVVDKHGEKLQDTHHTRLAMVRSLEAMNRMILRFNLHYLRKGWEQRVEKNDGTIYRSRPDPADYLQDLDTISRLAALKGFAPELSTLVEGGLLDSKDFFFLQRFESFCREHGETVRSLKERAPTDADVALCRDYFEQRRRSLRILKPLYGHLMQVEPIRPAVEDRNRLIALCRPMPAQGFALDEDQRLYLTDAAWLAEPVRALEPFRIVARTGCGLAEDAHDALSAAVEAWTPEFIARHRTELGAAFRDLLEESVRQATTAAVFRGMRHVGLLQRYVPGFARISGLIHTVRDHTYTVDEHSILAVEALLGLSLLGRVFPRMGPSAMRRDYQRLDSPIALAVYALKYGMEQRMLRGVPQVRSHPTVHPFFTLMDDVRRNSLEYLVDMNLPEQGHGVCLSALLQVEEIRAALNRLIRLDEALGPEVRRDLALAALLHDMDKPDPDHGRSYAPRVDEALEAMGLALPERSRARITAIVRHHLDISEVTRRMGAEGETALADYMGETGGPGPLRELILFTYADRVAVHLDSNQNLHNAMLLSELLRIADEQQAAGAADKLAGK